MPTEMQSTPTGTQPSNRLKDELEYTAYSGCHAAVYDRYLAIPVQDRQYYENSEILSGVVLGAIEKLKQQSQAQKVPNLQELALVESLLDRFIDYCSSRKSSPRQLFVCILAWVSELVPTHADAVTRYIEKAERLGMGKYPDLRAALLFKRAELLYSAGRKGDAYQILSGLAEHYYLVPDRNLVSSILFLLGKTALLNGQAQSYKALLFSGLRYFYTRDSMRMLFTEQMMRTYRNFYRVFLDADRNFTDKILFLMHWFHHWVSKQKVFAITRISKMTRLMVVAYVYFLNYRLQHGKGILVPAMAKKRNGSSELHAQRGDGTKKSILITRAMGGIGDLLMMTPGFHALKKKFPDHQIVLAAPRQYHQLFIGNTDVQLVDIDQAQLDAGAFRQWFNFTDCPAARIESRTVPDVKMNRVDIFAHSLGIRGRRLRTMDRRPRYFRTEQEKDFQRRFWMEHHLENKRVIGVQLHSAERYKDYPHMAELVNRLAADAVVILFHNGTQNGIYGSSVIDPQPLSLREAFALAAACDAIIAPDSSFVHFAAAFDIPCVVISGPVDGKNRVKPYASCAFVDARKMLQCVPCWRNEELRCKLTETRISACMGNITPGEIIAVLEKTLSRGKCGIGSSVPK